MVSLPPKPALIDTNLLVGYFYPNDQHYEMANFTIESQNWSWIVVQAVLTEAWGILNSRNPHFAFRMLQELGNPGKFFFLDCEPFSFARCREIVLRHRVDVADALVSNIAAHLAETASRLNMPIFTFDVGDFIRIVRGGVIYDVQNQEALKI